MEHRTQHVHGSTPAWRPSTSLAAAQLAMKMHAQRRRLLAALLLGVNLWGMALLWPLLSVPETSGSELALALAGLLPLLLGGAAHALLAGNAQLGNQLAGALWLVAYPGTLVALLAMRPEPDTQLHHGPIALALLWLSLCAYGAAAAAACAIRPPSAEATHAALGSEPWDAPARRHLWLQRLVIPVVACGAAAIAVIAPSRGGYAALEQGWGDAALAGGTLTAVVGAALGVAVLGVFLGSGLRATGPEPPRGDPALRVAWFASLSLIGAVTYFVVQP